MKAKRVRESLYEFERGRDPKRALGINILENIYDEMDEDFSTEYLSKNINDALLWSVKKGIFKYVIYLIEKGADIHYKDDLALRWAANYNHYDIVKYLIEKGADVNAKDSQALALALQHKYLDIVQLLLDNGAYKRYDNL